MIKIIKKYCPYLKIFQLYLAKHFLIRFLVISLGSLSLVYIITLVETIRRLKGDEESSFSHLAYLTFAQIPPVIDKVFPFLILLSTLWSLYSLMKGSEITILKSAGISLLKISKIYCLVGLFISGLYVFCVMPFLVGYHQDYRNWQFKSSLYHENLTQKLFSDEGQTILVKIGSYNPIKHQAKDISLSYLDANNLVVKFYHASIGYYDILKKQISFPEIYFMDVGGERINFSEKQKNFYIPITLDIYKRENESNNTYDDIYDYRRMIESQKQKNLSPHQYRISFYNLLIFPMMCSIYSFIACVSLPSILRGKAVFFNIMIAIGVGLVFYLADGWFLSLAAHRSIPLLLALVTAKITVTSLCFFYIFDKEYGFSKK